MIRLFLKILLVVFVAALVSIGVDHFYRKASDGVHYKFPRNIFIPGPLSEQYNIVALGNSHVEDGLTFERYMADSLDLSSVAQSFEYDLAMLKMHTNQIEKDAVILINVSPLSLSQKTPKPEEYTNMNYYDGRLSPLLIPHIKWSEYIQIQLVPFTRAGFLWREKHAKQTKEKAMNTFATAWEKDPTPTPPKPPIIPKEPIPSPTPTRSPFSVTEIQKQLSATPSAYDKRLDESAQFIVRKWYHSGDFGTQYFAQNRKDLKALIEYCIVHNWRPVLITLPINHLLLTSLQPDYMQKYVYDHVAAVKPQDVDYFDFNALPQLSKNNTIFENSDHLNPQGAIAFSYVLLQKLIDEGYVPEDVDGYDYP